MFHNNDNIHQKNKHKCDNKGKRDEKTFTPTTLNASTKSSYRIFANGY